MIMIGYLIATHGKLAEGLVDSAELIMGSNQKIKTMSITQDTSIEEFGENMLKEIQEVDEGDGTIVFTDLLLASPYNQASINYKKLKGKCEYRVISGTNLPMILEALNQRLQNNVDLDVVVEAVLEQGKDGIKEFFQEFDKFTQ